MVTQGNIRGGQQGVTLVELMIGAVVAAIIIAAMVLNGGSLLRPTKLQKARK